MPKGHLTLHAIKFAPPCKKLPLHSSTCSCCFLLGPLQYSSCFMQMTHAVQSSTLLLSGLNNFQQAPTAAPLEAAAFCCEPCATEASSIQMTTAVQSSILPPSGLKRCHQGRAPALAASTTQGDLNLGLKPFSCAVSTTARAHF